MHTIFLVALLAEQNRTAEAPEENSGGYELRAEIGADVERFKLERMGVFEWNHNVPKEPVIIPPTAKELRETRAREKKEQARRLRMMRARMRRGKPAYEPRWPGSPKASDRKRQR